MIRVPSTLKRPSSRPCASRLVCSVFGKPSVSALKKPVSSLCSTPVMRSGSLVSIFCSGIARLLVTFYVESVEPGERDAEGFCKQLAAVISEDGNTIASRPVTERAGRNSCVLAQLGDSDVSDRHRFVEAGCEAFFQLVDV